MIPERQTDHVKLITQLIDTLGVKCYLELGTYHGECIQAVSTRLLSLYPKDHWLAIGVDLARPPEIEPLIQSNFIDFWQMSTDQFFVEGVRAYEEFDMIFIDADHNSDAVRRDFENSLKFIKDQGIILLHDTYPANAALTDPGYCGDAWKFADQYSDKYEGCEFCTLPYSPGLTIVRKREKHLPWLQ